MTVFVYNYCHFKIQCVYLFRPQANGNCLFFTFSIAMCRDNRYVDGLIILTAIELYLNSEFYSKHPSFFSLISKHSKVFCSIDAILVISVSHNALDSNKTKGELVQNEIINVSISLKWVRLLLLLV